MQRASNVILSIVFCLILIAPLSLWLTGLEPKGGADEKRPIAGLPGLDLLGKSVSEYTGAFDKYFNDNFPLRQELIRANSLARVFGLGDSPVASVRLGREGWLYYNSEFDLEDFECVMPYTAEDLAKIENTLRQRADWLAKRGARLVVCVIPNKSTAYSEFLPERYHRIGQRSRLDQVKELMARLDFVDFIDGREGLEAAKASLRTYQRTDTHWNDFGALIGEEIIAKGLAKRFPAMKPLTLADYEVTRKKVEGGDLSGLMSLKDVLTEDGIFLSPRFTPRAKDAPRGYPEFEKIRERHRVVKETGDTSLPRAVIFRDSFGVHLIPFLSEALQSSTFIWNFQFNTKIIEAEKPDVVLIVCVERYLNCLMIENPPEVRGD